MTSSAGNTMAPAALGSPSCSKLARRAGPAALRPRGDLWAAPHAKRRRAELGQRPPRSARRPRGHPHAAGQRAEPGQRLHGRRVDLQAAHHDASRHAELGQQLHGLRGALRAAAPAAGWPGEPGQQPNGPRGDFRPALMQQAIKASSASSSAARLPATSHAARCHSMAAASRGKRWAVHRAAGRRTFHEARGGNGPISPRQAGDPRPLPCRHSRPATWRARGRPAESATSDRPPSSLQAGSPGRGREDVLVRDLADPGLRLPATGRQPAAAPWSARRPLGRPSRSRAAPVAAALRTFSHGHGETGRSSTESAASNRPPTTQQASSPWQWPRGRPRPNPCPNWHAAPDSRVEHTTALLAAGRQQRRGSHGGHRAALLAAGRQLWPPPCGRPRPVIWRAQPRLPDDRASTNPPTSQQAGNPLPRPSERPRPSRP